MEKNDLENPVPKEQFSDDTENTEVKGKSIEKPADSPTSDNDEEKVVNKDIAKDKEEKQNKQDNTELITPEESNNGNETNLSLDKDSKTESTEKDEVSEDAKVKDKKKDKVEEIKNEEEKEDTSSDSDKEAALDKEKNKAETVDASNNEQEEKDVNIEETTDKKVIDKEEKEEQETTSEDKEEKSTEEIQQNKDEEVVKDEDTTETDDKAEKKPISSEPEEIIDFSKLSKSDLVKVLKEVIDNKSVAEARNDIEAIKVNFYKKHKQDLDQIKASFLQEGGSIEDFKPQEDLLEVELKELLNKYKSLKLDFNKQLEVDKEKNLEDKYKIIEEIKDLINRKESINKTFHEFRELQKRWREIGLVPQQKVKDLWETYHHNVETFYDYIKINKELRDLDLKKNMELKIGLCEKAEDLLIEPSVIKAFEELQKLHVRWREIGPVSREYKDSTWERFKAATTSINKKYQQHFEELKKVQKKNLEAKTLLCEKVEEINHAEFQNHKDWEERSNEVKELQKVWKTIGFAPKKHNNKIYQRFREACDQFFASKREFYAENKELQNNNLQLKLDLCAQAESLKDSTDWKKTTEELIQLQSKWKEVGPVPKKQSDEVWKRFRTACDSFFNRKKEFFSNIDSKYDNNLKLKEGIIKAIDEFKPSTNVEDNIKVLKDFQKQWSEIGFVPFKDKERIQKEYRDAINKHFDSLAIDDNNKQILKFKNKVESIRSSPKFDQRIRSEREKFINKLKKLESNIVLWENNIGFFAKSKNADSMIEDVESKIARAKEEIAILEEKINIIDNMG